MARNGAIIAAAASGAGFSLARHFLGKGWRVVMTDINTKGENIVKDLGSDVLWVHTNITDWDSQRTMFQKGMLNSNVIMYIFLTGYLAF